MMNRSFPMLCLRAFATLLCAALSLSAACDSSSSDGSCVSDPSAGSSCDPEVPSCVPTRSCGTAWICAASDHRWVNVSSACVISPMCSFAVEDAACSPNVPACPEDAGPCGPVVKWTCQPDADTWARSVIGSPCDAEDGDVSDGGISDAGSRD